MRSDSERPLVINERRFDERHLLLNLHVSRPNRLELNPPRLFIGSAVIPSLYLKVIPQLAADGSIDNLFVLLSPVRMGESSLRLSKLPEKTRNVWYSQLESTKDAPLDHSNVELVPVLASRDGSR